MNFHAANDLLMTRKAKRNETGETFYRQGKIKISTKSSYDPYRFTLRHHVLEDIFLQGIAGRVRDGTAASAHGISRGDIQ